MAADPKKIEAEFATTQKLITYTSKWDEQTKVGIRYYLGNGVVQDWDKAIELFTEAAKQGSRKAMCALYNLGLRYDNGLGVVQDKTKAIQLWSVAASQDYPPALTKLALAYLKGFGVVKNVAKALGLLKKSATILNDPEAQFYFASCYMGGAGVTKDVKMALTLYLRAAKQGHLEAKVVLFGLHEDSLLEHDDRVYNQLEAAGATQQALLNLGEAHIQAAYAENAKQGYRGVPRDQALFLKHAELSAKQGNPHGEYLLGEYFDPYQDTDKGMYLNPQAKPPIQEKALGYYQLSAAKGFEPSLRELAYRFFGVLPKTPKDVIKAIQLLKESQAQDGFGSMKSVDEIFKSSVREASEGKAEAHYILGIIYFFGLAARITVMHHTSVEGIQFDIFKALEHFNTAAVKQHPEANYMLGLCYANGYGMDVDCIKAVQHYKAAVQLGVTNAMYNLAICYENGIGIQKNVKEAIELYHCAANQGHPHAAFNLAVRYENGSDVNPDRKKASEYYHIAIRAQYGLELCSAIKPEFFNFSPTGELIPTAELTTIRKSLAVYTGEPIDPIDISENMDYFPKAVNSLKPEDLHLLAQYFELANNSIDRSLMKAYRCLEVAFQPSFKYEQGFKQSKVRLDALAPIVPLQKEILWRFNAHIQTTNAINEHQHTAADSNRVSDLIADYAFEEQPRSRPAITLDQ